MKKVCKNCQYFREGYWCSNSKSVWFKNNGTLWVASYHTCPEFTPRNKKAPLWMQLFNKVMKGKKL
jgi:hypothetical protein